MTGPRRFVVRVDDRSHQVEVFDDGRVVVDGHEHETATIEDGVVSLRAEGLQQVRVSLGGSPRPVQAAVAGARVEVGVKTASEAALDVALGTDARTVSDGRLVAPMPGRVVQVAVAVGDHVSEGDPAIVVEAMKMENELGAPCTGTVTEVAVAPGDAVDAGRLLIAFAPDVADADA